MTTERPAPNVRSITLERLLPAKSYFRSGADSGRSLLSHQPTLRQIWSAPHISPNRDFFKTWSSEYSIAVLPRFCVGEHSISFHSLKLRLAVDNTIIIVI